jgi:aldehyde:ferredoxin oxidoreductase
MTGWKGKILRVDLSAETIADEPLSEQTARAFIGGRGLNMKILYDEVPVGADPLGPENVLVFGTGPLNGTPIGMGRMTVSCKSPATGLNMDGNAGKFFAPTLKFAGYDAIILTGKAKRPTYLWLNDGKAELRDASRLWGKTTFETDRLLKDELGDEDVQLRYIGPGGENLSPHAVILGNMGNSGGRGGAGAVMGSKNLKAIAVKGTGRVDVADPARFLEAMDEIYEELNYRTTCDPLLRPWHIYGSMFVPPVTSAMGAFMTANGQKGVFPEGLDEIRGERLQRDFVRSPVADFCCPYASCVHWLEAKGTQWGDLSFQGIHVGTQLSSGSMLKITDPHAVMKIQEICNQLGVCFISVGTVLAWAMEAFEKGLLTEEDTDGIPLTFGNGAAAVQMIEKIAHRDGFGAILADGVKKAAAHVGRGSEAFALEIKGLEFTNLEPRALFHMGLAYAVNDMGGDHKRVHLPYPPALSTIPKEILEAMPFDVHKAFARQSPEEKGKLVKWMFDSRAALNSLETCVFTNRGRLYMDFRPYAKALSAATGMEFTYQDLWKAGERTCNLERSFNVREGARRKDDRLPRRFLEETLKEGGSRGVVVPLEPMLDDYYEARGWDKRTGIPTREKLVELGLEDVADDLERYR